MINIMLVLLSTGVVLLGITLPYIWKLFGGEPPASTLELSNLMIVILTLVAIFAGGAYSVLSTQLQAESKQATEQAIKKAEDKMISRYVWSFLNVGKTFWDMYEHSGRRKNKSYLELAISFTNIAYGEGTEDLPKLKKWLKKTQRFKRCIAIF